LRAQVMNFTRLVFDNAFAVLPQHIMF
jgi:hypothetical protein